MTLDVRFKIQNELDYDDYHIPDFFVPKLKHWIDENFVQGKDYRMWSTMTHYCYGSKEIETLITNLEFYNFESMNLFLTVYGEYYERYDKHRRY